MIYCVRAGSRPRNQRLLERIFITVRPAFCPRQPPVGTLGWCENRLMKSILDDGAGPSTVLVTAHPDDEAMFFAPSLLCLSSLSRIHVLCLSTGDFEGKGPVRKRELPLACVHLGVPPERVVVIDDPRLRDGPDTHWSPAHVATVVQRMLRESGARRILTFDCHGISGHANHIAAHRGVRHLMRAGVQEPLHVYELLSTSKFRIHLGIVDALVTRAWLWIKSAFFWLVSLAWAQQLFTGHQVGSIRRQKECSQASVVWTFAPPPWRALQAVHAAMRAHRSQYVWYRRLYVLTSRFVFLNTLVSVRPGS